MKHFILSLVFAFSSYHLAHAADTIGHVKKLTGDAWIVTNGEAVKAKLSTPVFLGSVLKTDKGGSMGITFKDNTRMSFGPETEITVDEYLYVPKQNHMRFAANMLKGTLNYVSGSIARAQPDAVSIRTPGGTIGVRGTQFLVKIDPK